MLQWVGVMLLTHVTWEMTNMLFKHSRSYTHHAVGRHFMTRTNQKTNIQNRDWTDGLFTVQILELETHILPVSTTQTQA